jgi:hypothetical protein
LKTEHRITRWGSGRWYPVFVAAVWLVGTSVRVEAQTFRGWAGTSAQLVELRPLGLDTVPRSDVVTDADGRLLYNGQEVTCVLADRCTGYLPLPETRALSVTQDVSLTFWGLGVQGLSVTTLLRGRARAGADLIWPRADDEFDAILAYGQLRRGAWRLRLGRQEVRSGLGFSGFDGVSGVLSRGEIRGEIYAGRSLARGLREPANTALSGLEDFFIDESALLVGAAATVRRWGVLATGRYHREIHADRSGLVSERASLVLSTAVPHASLTGSFDYDFSFRRVGKANVTLSAPLSDGRWLVELAGQRYVPYFDLSTIWGFFEPVPYSEVVARGGWSPSAEIGVRLTAGWRRYGDTETPVVLQPLRDTGWRADLLARWRPGDAWAVSGRYELEWGPGGFLNSLDASAEYAVTERLSGSISLMSFQKLEEYRLGEGRAFGAGASGAYRFGDRYTLSGGFSLIRHRDGGNVFTSPWNQSRAWTSLRVELGGDPGLRAQGGPS